MEIDRETRRPALTAREAIRRAQDALRNGERETAACYLDLAFAMLDDEAACSGGLPRAPRG